MTPETTDPFSKLMLSLSALNVDKYGAFKTINTNYKILDIGRGIDTDILIPQTLLCQKTGPSCPIIVRIHGGFLVTGSSLYPPWFSDWILEYAIQNNAIIVSPNYRLLPEASGSDILEDINDVWAWLRSGAMDQAIQKAGYDNIKPNIDKTLLVGESAGKFGLYSRLLLPHHGFQLTIWMESKGGYLAMQLALSYPSHIRALIGAYPILDLKSPFYTEAYAKPIIGVPNVPSDIIETHLAALRGSRSPSIVTAADPPERLRLAFSIFQNGRLLEFLGAGDGDGEDPRFFPLERVERLAALGRLDLPPLFLFHGKQDSAVPAEGTTKFASLLQRVEHIVYIQDGDHGFDYNATLETGWLKDGLGMISKAWVGNDSISHL
ncbi:hypothetical protein ASPVEDRAFT_82808 [Aspergillus versicolor CBS 583.65]|uniref:Alpha/beta hydrolase fold-3 domain-containing protein n=1 Tax=Aspergillus versicolor CBS 583.65 TaxID=1036611 RepID=A0A1L9PIC1_ASPVE|nr:uncharacterized protein ASPVEDRAFT_82808 [Aspergillus versicolor CBS 583.65]OJJ01284.1 hypothetical protein ASPVEDRAFT_82808 [Aspergillus versicolor CBS 583.65]